MYPEVSVSLALGTDVHAESTAPPVNRTLYEKVIAVSRKYFGPAADRFIARQIRNHLNKEPDRLLKHDLAQLIDWILVATAVLFEDEKVVNAYAEDLRALVVDSKPRRASRKRSK